MILSRLGGVLICYCWMTGIADAWPAYVRWHKRARVQWLTTCRVDEHRGEIAQLVETAVEQIEAGHFLPHSKITFPQNGCVGCSHLGLAVVVGNGLGELNSVPRRAGASELDWLDQFDD